MVKGIQSGGVSLRGAVAVASVVVAVARNGGEALEFREAFSSSWLGDGATGGQQTFTTVLYASM
jgi:hypothetical protein